MIDDEVKFSALVITHKSSIVKKDALQNFGSQPLEK